KAEDDSPLQLGGGVVKVDDRARRALEAFEGTLDQLAAALRQDLNGDVFGYQAFFDQQADEVEVRLRRGRKPDLDLLEADIEEHVPEAPLALGIHGVDERLVAVAQVHAAPQRGTVD